MAQGTSTFSTLATDILGDRWEFHPTLAASAGLHRYDGRLPDYSTASVERRIARIDRQLKALDAVEARGLNRRQRLEAGVLRGMLLTERFDFAEARLHQTLPAYALFGMSIVNYLMRRYAPLDRRLHAVARLQAHVPRYLRQLRAATDRRLADTFYEMAVMAASGIRGAYGRELAEHAAKASPEVRRRVAKTSAAAVEVLTAYLDHLESTHKPRVTTKFALGRKRYERMIRAEHLASISVERLLAAGVADLEANKRAFLDTAMKIDPAGTPRQVMERLSEDHPSAGTLIDETQAMLEEIRQFLIDRDIITVPSEERAKVVETPRFYRFATAAMNSPGSFEKVAKEAFYYVTPVEDAWTPEKREEWLRHLNYATLRNISVHECYPGHYVHMLHRRQLRSRTLKSYFSYAFTEGWAHYAEEMMVDQGFGDGDPRARLAMLQDALLRNCRYVSSIRMHTGGWSWEDATRFFVENAFLDRLPAEREAKRGTWDAGYLNYTLGKLMIKKLRSDYLARNPGATLREFHDTLLSLGAPPLGLVREHLLGPDAGPAL